MSSPRPIYHVLVDSDAWVGLLWEKDAHHQTATGLFAEIEKQKQRLVTTSYVVLETATVLSHRKGQDAANTFLKTIEKVPTIFVSEKLHQQSLTLFADCPGRGTSVVDCSNVVVMRSFGIPRILSFDEFYFKSMDLKAA